MKLKEKLADEYYQNRPEGFGEPIYDFLAGFEKAREMAQRLFVDKAMIRPKSQDEPFTLNTIVVNGERFEFTLLEDFDRLGEEDL